MTKRREQTIELAEAMGVQPRVGESTSELMDRIIERVEGRGRASRRQQEESERREEPRRLRRSA